MGLAKAGLGGPPDSIDRAAIIGPCAARAMLRSGAVGLPGWKRRRYQRRCVPVLGPGGFGPTGVIEGHNPVLESIGVRFNSYDLVTARRRSQASIGQRPHRTVWPWNRLLLPSNRSALSFELKSSVSARREPFPGKLLKGVAVLGPSPRWWSNHGATFRLRNWGGVAKGSPVQGGYGEPGATRSGDLPKFAGCLRRSASRNPETLDPPQPGQGADPQKSAGRIEAGRPWQPAVGRWQDFPDFVDPSRKCPSRICLEGADPCMNNDWYRKHDF